MERSPESTVAPPGDEVVFDCQPSVLPDRFEWRFRAFTGRNSASAANLTDYVDLTNRHSGYNISSNDRISQLRVYVNQHTAGEYQCVTWFGSLALASIPARLMLAAISLDDDSSLMFDQDSNRVSGRDNNSQVRRNPSQQQMVHWKVSPGNNILIKCRDVYSNPPPVWSFYKDNNAIPPIVSQLPTGSLVLTTVQPKDSGIYWCSAVNSITGNEIKLPQKVSLSIERTDFAPPSFLMPPPTRITVRPGGTTVLECPGVGWPVPKAVWSRPTGSISKNRTTDMGYGLQIRDVQHDDHGMYTCRLDNGIAPAHIHNVKLEVLEPPEIVEGPQHTLTNETGSQELRCIAKGYPPPVIYWTINGADTRNDSLIVTNGSSLMIKSVRKTHAGIVQCFARNDVGEVMSSNLLQVIPAMVTGNATEPLGGFPYSAKNSGKQPKGRKKHKHHVMIPPSRPSITRLSDHSVMVRWSVPSKKHNQNTMAIQFFKLQYRDVTKREARSNWRTANDDIPPQVRLYELDNLMPDHIYRFRIAAVYTNNDNMLSNTSANFQLQRETELGPNKSHLDAPTLTKVEAVSEKAIVLHWQFPPEPTTEVDGFYAYYRPASTAGEYLKATVDGMAKRHFMINHLEPGTPYEFKLQSFTASAASDFSAILTGKTLKPPTQRPAIVPSVVTSKKSAEGSHSWIPLVVVAASCFVLVLSSILIYVCIKKRRARQDDNETENKSPPDHIQAEPNGFPSGNGGNRVLGSPIHKSSRLNGVPRMNITSNPLAHEGDKNRNVMELRFLPPSAVAAANTVGLPPSSASPSHLQHHAHHNNHHHSQHHTQNNNTPATAVGTPPMLMGHGRTLERKQQPPSLSDGVDIVRGPSVRRTARHVPGSPRQQHIGRGTSSEFLHNRSPMPQRAIGKRNRLGSHTENMSSGSLNSIEV